MDHLEPRPPPWLTHLPTPFNMMSEPPNPIVPEVSLIFDTSFELKPGFSGNTNTSSKGPKTEQPLKATVKLPSQPPMSKPLNLMEFENTNEYATYLNTVRSRGSPSLNRSASAQNNLKMSVSKPQKDASFHSSNKSNNDLKILIKLMAKQEAHMVKLEHRVQELVDFQNNHLVPLIKQKTYLDKDVQTDDNTFSHNKSGERLKLNYSSSSSTSLQSLPSSKEGSASPHRTPGGLSKDSSNCKTENKSSGNKREQAEGRPTSSKSNPTNGKEKTDDLSLTAVLRDLKLPSVQVQSMYSDASIGVLDLQEYYDDSLNFGSDMDSQHLGPSVSAYASSSSDDENFEPVVKPTVTFYRSVLGNVNRILENDGNMDDSPTASESEQPAVHTRTPKKHLAMKTPVADSEDYILTRKVVKKSSANVVGGDYRNNSDSSDTYTPPSKPQRHFHAKEIEKKDGSADLVVDATKRHLEKLGVKFSPNGKHQHGACGPQRNVMIQQNVYNSVFIPTLTCAPTVPVSFDSNSEHFNELANKYIPQGDMQQYLAAQGSHKPEENSTEATMYGMTSNLSFATKQYLQRYGLVNRAQQQQVSSTEQFVRGRPPLPLQHKIFFNEPMAQSTDRILDLTALRNQPKLM